MKNNIRFFDYFLLLLAIVSFAYFLFILTVSGLGFFVLIYPLFSLFCAGIAVFEIIKKRRFLSLFPRALGRVILAALLLSIFCFCFVEANVIFQSTKKDMRKSEYLIVLGAQVKGTTPSRVLRYRLDAAVEYSRASPNTKIIVSGGQGPGEDDSEANCMKKYLVEKNIPKESVLVEDQSTTTYENLKFSKALIDKKTKDNTDNKVTIVTNGFHCYRALSNAKSLGYNATTYAAEEYPWLIPHSHIREFFAVVVGFFLKT